MSTEFLTRSNSIYWLFGWGPIPSGTLSLGGVMTFTMHDLDWKMTPLLPYTLALIMVIARVVLGF